MKRIFVVRHGETEWNSARRLQGHTDIDLSRVGAEQALALRPVIESLRPDSAITSDLMRASRTAALVGFPDAKSVETLREMDLGAWTGALISEICARERQNYLGWRSGEVDPPQGESWSAFGLRVKTTVLDALTDAERLLVVCHDGVVRALLQQLVGLRPSQIASVSPASLSIIAWQGEQGALELFNYRPGDPELSAPP